MYRSPCYPWKIWRGWSLSATRTLCLWLMLLRAPLAARRQILQQVRILDNNALLACKLHPPWSMDS